MQKSSSFTAARTHVGAIALIAVNALSLSSCSPASVADQEHGPAVYALKSKLESGCVVYGVVPPLFGAKPLRGVTARLDQIQSLGVDALWISPINATDDSGPISYSVTDYFKIRADFGTEREFRTLVAEAHRRGLKVMMDFVPNHTSNQHPQFLDAQRLGRASRFYDYYARDEEGEPTYYFNWSNLMNLNYANEEVRLEMRKAFRYWISEFGVDGYRVDAAWGVEQREPGFWKDLIEDLRSLNPSVVMLAEAGARDPVYIRSGFDLAYDWNSQLGHWAWEKAFDQPEMTGDLLRAQLVKNSDPSRVFRFINNNDTGARFITRFGLGLTRVAAALTMTVPGVPLVYTGDEIGAEFSPYDDPTPLDWSDRHGLTPYYRKLIAIRKSSEALRSGAVKILAAPASVLAFERVAQASSSDAGSSLRLSSNLFERVVVVLNFGAGVAQMTLEGKWTDVVTGQPYQGSIAAQSAVILKPAHR